MSMEQPPPPPPPPPGSGGYGATSPANFAMGDTLSYGWNAYWKNIGPMLVIAVVVVLIQIAFSAVASSIDAAVPRILVQIIGNLVGLLITLGWLRVALGITNGVKPELADVFKAEGYGIFLLASILFYIGTVIGLILLIIPGIIFIATFGFYGFVIAERGDGVAVLESLQRSAELARPPLDALRDGDRALPREHRGPDRVLRGRGLHARHHADHVGVPLPRPQRRDGDGLAVAPESYCRLNGGYSSVRKRMYAYTLVYQRA